MKRLLIILMVIVLGGAAAWGAGKAFCLSKEVKQPLTSAEVMTPEMRRIQFPANGADIKFVVRNITADNKTTTVFSWQTEKERSGSYLEYAVLTDTVNALRIDAVPKSFVAEQKQIYRYVATLNGLQAGTTYAYRISDGQNVSGWSYFRTESGDNFKALIFPDSQSSDYKVWRKTAQNAWSANTDAEFFTNMGDLVDNGEQYWQWTSWLDGVEGMSDKIAAAPVMGNHEAYTLDWQMTEPHTYLNLFTLPDNGVQGLNGHFYSYDYGNVHFVVLDTQLDELKEFTPDLYEQEVRWLKQDLAATQKKWKIAMMHRHVFNFRLDGSLTEPGDVFMPLFEQYGVDAVFSGHIHAYRRTWPLKEGRTGQGPVYISTGASGDRLRKGFPPLMPVEAAADLEQALPNYLVLEANDQALKITDYRQDGKVLDSVEIKK